MARLLVIYSVFLLLVAVAAVIYLPEAGTFGFNDKAKTALISGGTAAAISLLWAYLLSRGQLWAGWAALVTTGLLAGVFIWRSIVSWQAVQGGEGHKSYAATLISLMAAASLALFIALLSGLIAKPTRAAE